MASNRLDNLLAESAKRHQRRIAVQQPGARSLTYRELDEASDHISDTLVDRGVMAGDRVGLCVEKTPDAVAAIFGILKAGAAYVPVDPTAPAERNAYILADCSVRAAILQRDIYPGLSRAAPDLLAAVGDLQTPGGADFIIADGAVSPQQSPAIESLAYILYTSGSTGMPKGVMHTHRSSLSFVNWCSDEFAPGPNDRFSSHAPFHFDLSILDLFVSIKHGAAIVLIDEELGKQPMLLGPTIADQGISVWYSTPSVLRLLVEFGRLNRHDLSALRLVIFAGEVFPMKHLLALSQLLPHPRFYNLYGPTETNVCTYYEATPELIAARERPLPIGSVCSGDDALVVDGDGNTVKARGEGELLISGGSVMAGYWNLEEQNAQAFHVDPDGRRWYRTGDIVKEEQTGVFTYLGRRDRMIKRRGYRVELGEIEAALYKHPNVAEAAVVASSNDDAEILIKAFLVWNSSHDPSIIQLKQFCSQNLPGYMVPDRFGFLPSLPKTSTDKIDYQMIKALE